MQSENNKKKRKTGIDTRNKILEVSANLFANKGYDSVSLREIASLLDIKESSLYNHFKNKADIRDSLFKFFAEETYKSRPSDVELDRMLEIMLPEEIFKFIVFQVGSQISKMLQDVAMFIHYEKFRNSLAAETYHKYMVSEPVNYYKNLIEKMIIRKMVKPIDAQLFAEQYNYVSIALTQEYFISQNGLIDNESTVKYMIKTLSFFCDLMKN